MCACVCMFLCVHEFFFAVYISPTFKVSQLFLKRNFTTWNFSEHLIILKNRAFEIAQWGIRICVESISETANMISLPRLNNNKDSMLGKSKDVFSWILLYGTKYCFSMLDSSHFRNWSIFCNFEIQGMNCNVCNSWQYYKSSVISLLFYPPCCLEFV